jgi:hypothetical protein
LFARKSRGLTQSNGEVQYYSNGWHDFGTTGTDGKASLELLPTSYSFSMEYAYGRIQKAQNIGTASEDLSDRLGGAARKLGQRQNGPGHEPGLCFMIEWR